MTDPATPASRAGPATRASAAPHPGVSSRSTVAPRPSLAPRPSVARRTLLVGGAASLAAALAGCARGPRLPASTFALGPATPGDVLGTVNAARRGGGRTAMRLDPDAQRAAERHARAMARAERMAHDLPRGPRFGARMRRDGVALPAAENVAVGQRDVGAAVAAWMNSPGHRRNLLDRRFGGVGVASATGADGRPYWAMVLTP